MRTIGVVTTSRADYGIYLPILRAIQADSALDLALIVTGMHLVPEFGLTFRQIEADGFPIHSRLETLLASDTPTGVAKSMGLALQSFADLFSRFRPDILLVLGDRFEMAAAPLAALPFKIPVAHVHGGEVTQGAIDDALRHSITKLSHLHFVSTEVYAQRVQQLGEEPWRISVTGAPSLDNLYQMELLSVEALQTQFALPAWEESPLLVTFHPITLDYEQSNWHITELLTVLATRPDPIIFTLPNADMGGRLIIEQIRAFVAQNPRAVMVESLGTQGYFSLMKWARVMLGNSSSGILEAASFGLPVVNIGTRQAGRVHPPNVITTGYSQQEIFKGLAQACSSEFRASLSKLVNPYGDGSASPRIIHQLKSVALDARLMVKHFWDVGFSQHDG